MPKRDRVCVRVCVCLEGVECVCDSDRDEKGNNFIYKPLKIELTMTRHNQMLKHEFN